jgi:hypothetical protein
MLLIKNKLKQKIIRPFKCQESTHFKAAAIYLLFVK